MEYWTGDEFTEYIPVQGWAAYCPWEKLITKAKLKGKCSGVTSSSGASCCKDLGYIFLTKEQAKKFLHEKSLMPKVKN